MAGSCNLKGTFTDEKAVLAVEDGGGSCAKPSLNLIFAKLFPEINLNTATEKFILAEQFFFKKMEIIKSSKEVSLDATAKDKLTYCERKIILEDGTLNLGFTAGAPVVGIKLWKIKVEGR